MKATSTPDGNTKIEITHNPGQYDLPQFAQKDGAYYLHFPGEEITSAIVQSNDFSKLVFAQLEYDNNGVVIRFVTLNNEVRSTDFTLRVILKKVEKELSRPAPLSQVISESLVSVTKRRP